MDEETDDLITASGDAWRRRLRLPRCGDGLVDLDAAPTEDTPGWVDGKRAAKQRLAALGDELADQQERLFAHGRAGGTRRVLLVLQGMDTSGKGGVVRTVLGRVDPQGVRITGFGAPTAQEREHHFLWRIRRALPAAGLIGVFDRSHYEDVLAARVRGIVDEATVQRRLSEIVDFEASLVDEGVLVLKVLLHVSLRTQATRLLARLDDPAKHWKYDPTDLDDRARWADYRRAYEDALVATDTEQAPWYVVPADAKAYRNLAVGGLLLETLRDLDLGWPSADFEVESERRRLLTVGRLGRQGRMDR